tara:strand:+ start:155 stop:550 length:396 start_codon:yes stop_codon:yes gene_type:complete
MVAVADLLPPSPEHVIVKLILPTAEIVTVSVPEVALAPDQAPDAEQEVALVDDQVSVESEPTTTEVGLAEKLTVGAGTLGVVGVEPPPPPPPPHEDTRSKVKKIQTGLIFIYYQPVLGLLCKKLIHFDKKV